MFTVKHRESEALGAREFIYSASSIEVVFPGPARDSDVQGATNWDQCGIYLDPEPIDPERRFRGAREIILFGGEQTSIAQDRKGGKVWVMNEQGATVATYDL